MRRTIPFSGPEGGMKPILHRVKSSLAEYPVISAKLVCMNVNVVLVPYNSGHILNERELGLKHLFERVIAPVLLRLGHELRTETLTSENHSRRRSAVRSSSPE